MAGRNNWTDEETILAFYYYCQIPFGKIHKTNPLIIKIAEMIGRSPSAVVFKMGNLGHFDPSLQARNVKGLSNASKRDEQVVNKFIHDWESLAIQAKQIEAAFLQKSIEQVVGIDIANLPVGMDRKQLVNTRINQDFFREAVLSSYENTCCITGINTPALLVASHIKPWSLSNQKTERTNPCNGLCLNALHDKAFDRGLITILPDYTIRVSSTLLGNDDGAAWLSACNREQIKLPIRFLPAKEFLEYHNDMIFVP